MLNRNIEVFLGSVILILIGMGLLWLFYYDYEPKDSPVPTSIEVFAIDPIVLQNLSIVRPYIELCNQYDGAWMWEVDHESETIFGGCVSPSTLEGDTKEADRQIEDNDGNRYEDQSLEI